VASQHPDIQLSAATLPVGAGEAAAGAGSSASVNPHETASVQIANRSRIGIPPRRCRLPAKHPPERPDRQAGAARRRALTSGPEAVMVFHMKTTLVIDDGVFTRLKAEAARSGTTMSALVEAALRSFLERPSPKRRLPPLPSASMGVARVDIADRDALYRTMEED
jgi:hypothetical protein